MPPLVARIRTEVRAWRDGGYAGASDTSRTLLRWWFDTDHVVQVADGSVESFRWYFAQREAVESVIWLYDVKHARDKYDLMRFDASGAVSAGMFPEDWPRYVVKMATGAGKTKVLSLLIAWSFFHRLYEPGSTLARNFLLIAPNIIVLDRLRADFDGMRIFFKDSVLPDNGMAGRNWREDFQLTLHLQDDVRVVRDVGNLFLTNIHRIYLGDVREPTLEDDDLRDYFLQPFGERPSGKTTDSKTDLGELIRKIDELAVCNDEAHHIHDNAPGVAAFAKNYLRGGLQARLREDRRRPVELHARLHRQGRRRQHHHRRNERPRELDLPRKIARLAQWCIDATAASRAQGGPAYRFAYVDQDGFDRHPPATLGELMTMFREYQSATAA